MSENSGERKFIQDKIRGVHVGADGSAVVHGTIAHNYDSFEEAKERMAEVHGVNAEDIVFDRDANYNEGMSSANAAGRMAVGFRKWNSSWQPSGGNPNLN